MNISLGNQQVYLAILKSTILRRWIELIVIFWLFRWFCKIVTPVSKATKKIDADIPGAVCKNCQGDRRRNKLGQPEVLLHCSKCDSSSHPTCVGLNIELLQFVTSYNWECTDCKVCSKCQDHSDEEKMLFCDLCDRGYHSYCVGLEEIPSGRWHCDECSLCSLCGESDPLGGEELTGELVSSLRGKKIDWVFEFKPGSTGGKIYSHTMCIPCYRYTYQIEIIFIDMVTTTHLFNSFQNVEKRSILSRM